MSFVATIFENRSPLEKVFARLCSRRWWHSWFAREWRSLCPKCGRRIRYYWDGNDIEGHGTDICNRCAKHCQPIKPRRLVQVFKNVWDETARKYDRVPDFIGTFHGWGSTYQEFESGPGNYTCAIIEKADGTVGLEIVELIQFLTR